MFRVDVTEANEEGWCRIQDVLSESTISTIPLNQLVFQQSEVIVEITDWICYRPGYVERWVEVNGAVWYLDELSEEEAHKSSLTKDELINILQQALC